MPVMYSVSLAVRAVGGEEEEGRGGEREKGQ
jgi:hypothetical protein